MQSIIFDEPKFKELILYISDRCEGDPTFGAVKLNKILFLADYFAYAELGRPITGAEYIALDRGPAPKLMMPIRDSMADSGDLVVRRKRQFGFEQHRVIPLRDPDISMLEREEINLVEKVLEACQHETGAALSDMTHEWAGWRIAESHEVIPYPTIFLSDEPATKMDIQRASELAVEHGW